MQPTFARAQRNVLYLLMFIYFFYYCARQNFGFAILGIQETLSLTTTDTGILSATMLLAYGIGQAINGVLGDQYSPRLFVTLGAVLSVAFNFLASFATGFWSLFFPCFLIGYAQSLGFAPGSKLLTNWWAKKDRGKVFGLYLAASGVASIIAYAVSIFTLSYWDWRWLFRLPVSLLLVSAIIFYCLVRDKPQAAGFAPLHEEEETQVEMQGSAMARYRFVLRHFRFQMASIAMGCMNIARYGLIIWVPLIYFGEGHFLKGALSTIALPIGMALGSVAAGTISDKLFASDRIKPTIVFMLLATISITLLYLTPPDKTYLAMLLLFISGFLIYGPQSSLFALCPDLLGAHYTSTGVGIMNAYAYAFSGLSEILIGFIIQRTAHVSTTFIVVAGACFCSMIAALFALPRKATLVPIEEINQP